MKRILAFLVVSLAGALALLSQPSNKGVYQSDDHKIYIQKEAGIYLWISTSPDANSKKFRLFSDSSARYSNPMYLDTEGYNTFRSPSAVDTATKKTIYPLQDIIFELYADGLAPVSKAAFQKAATKTIEGKKYYSSALEIELTSHDAVSGIARLQYSLNVV